MQGGFGGAARPPDGGVRGGQRPPEKEVVPTTHGGDDSQLAHAPTWLVIIPSPNILPGAVNFPPGAGPLRDHGISWKSMDLHAFPVLSLQRSP